MEKKLEIVFLVSNDHSTDQRMHRICIALHNRGHRVHVVGRKLNRNISIKEVPYNLHLLSLKHKAGPLFYYELMKQQVRFVNRIERMDIISSVDADTILAASIIAKKREVKHIHDAHEWFTEVPELKGKPLKRAIWGWAEKRGFKTVHSAYTVSHTLKEHYDQISPTPLQFIPNYPNAKQVEREGKKEVDIIYQGAVNKGRCLEMLLMICKQKGYRLQICGIGDLFVQLKKQYSNATNITFSGQVSPDELHDYACQAKIGYNVLDNSSPSYNGSLPNKTFDYMQAEIPQIISNSQELVRLNTKLPFAIVTETEPSVLQEKIYDLLNNHEEYHALKNNVKQLKKQFLWENVEAELIQIYEQ